MTTQQTPPDPSGADHVPVLLREVLDGLQIRSGATVIDATLGGGGHTAEILAQVGPTGQVLGLDADPAAIRRVTEKLAPEIAAGSLTIIQTFFDKLAQVATAQNFVAVDGVLLDLGLSSFQLETTERGFSFVREGPLDMRFDLSQPLTAANIVNHWPEDEIADVIYEFGEEHRSRRIARFIVANRPFQNTAQLAEVVSKAVGGRRGKRIHPATQTFQALRIAVNDELGRISQVLPQCLEVLRPGGRLAIISFHSLEDRMIKQWMQTEASDWVHDETNPYGGYAKTPTLRMIVRKPITAGAEEREQNPRSRSAKLRIAEKL